MSNRAPNILEAKITSSPGQNSMVDLSLIMHQGELFELQNHDSEAEKCYNGVTQLQPNYAPAWHSLGLLAHKYGKISLAVDLVQKAVSFAPSELTFVRNLTELARRNGQLNIALEAGKAARSINPDDADANYNLGLVYTDLADYPNAIKAYQKVLEINPNHGFAWNNLGSAYEQQGNSQLAKNAYQKAVELNPQNAQAQNNLGAVCSDLGEIDKARSYFEAAIGAQNDFVEAHYNLSSMKTYQALDPQLKMLEELGKNQENLPLASRVKYGFAFGKALDDVGSYGRAFAHYELANHLQFSTSPINEGVADHTLEAIKRTFTKAFIQERQTWSASEFSPIFIVGMPRSGTSLLEQVLATHGDVFGAGELPNFHDALIQYTNQFNQDSFADGASFLTKGHIQSIASEYESKVRALSPDSRFIVDKMPANFFYLGLIYLAFPNARVIHAMRDPMDSCFSCYTKLFNRTMDFAYDQGTLGRYYVRYMQLMEHWKSVLPDSYILDMPYEHLVGDFENQAKRILNFVGLLWDEKCLEFHKTQRHVKTASVLQVRRPLYGTSVGRWQHFAHYLRPLLEIVRPYRTVEQNAAADKLLEQRDGHVEQYYQEAKALVDQGLVPGLMSTPLLIDQIIELQNKGEHTKALEQMIEYASHVQSSAILLHLKGISHYRLNQFDAAITSYTAALKLAPQFPSAYNSLGFVLQDIGQIEGAKKAFETALMQSPEFSMAKLNLSLAQLKLGDFENGWNNYESRWLGSAETADPTFQKPQINLPQWNGEAGTENQSILVVTEQGFGDTFQFSRYIRMLKVRFKHVAFACSEPTRRLMQWALGEDIPLMTEYPSDLSKWDWFCPLLSLPRAFGTKLDSIPALGEPITVPQNFSEYWGKKLASAAKHPLRIGVAWSGRKSHQYDARRSIAFSKLAPLLALSGISWVSLQKLSLDDEKPIIPNGADWIDWTAELNDFADTAALIQNLDIVITIDSAIAHLAASLGKPTWMLNRFDSEWRWLMGRTDSPWYPSLKIYGQPSFGDWDGAIAQVRNDLMSNYGLASALSGGNVKTQTENAVFEGAVNFALSISVAREFELANQMYGAGRLQEASAALRKIVLQNPAYAPAHYLLGVISFQMGEHLQAIDLIKKSIELDSQNAFFMANLTEMLRQVGKVDEAILVGSKAVQIAPTLAIAQSNLGVAYFDASLYDNSEKCHLDAIAIDPTVVQSYSSLGSIERARKNLPKAIEWYRKAIEVNPQFVEGISNLGAVLVESTWAKEALPILEHGLKLAPQSFQILSNLGLAYFKLEQFELARNYFERALEIFPEYPEALTGYACVLSEFNFVEQAQARLERALSLNPQKLDAKVHLAGIYTEQGRTQEAENLYKQVLSVDAGYVDAINGLANLALEVGQIDQAQKALQSVLDLDPENIEARFHLTQVKKVLPDSDNLIALERQAANMLDLSPGQKISLHYALGKSYDDIGKYDQAFEHFHAGAKLKREKIQYDPANDDLITSQIIEKFDKNFFSSLIGHGNPSAMPIFILGMPRSGTTLTEQIISSHPDVFGAGELSDLAKIIQQNHQGTQNLYPSSIGSISKEMLNFWGAEYVRRLNLHSPNALHITDKMPANYFFLGLIALMLPNAKIIHVRRNPVDTCISCYTRLFNRYQEATYDLVELGRHYRNYYRLMKHWRQVLPANSFYELNYEDLVADINQGAHHLIEYCGLDWNDSCLEFYKNKRSIRTASVAQVRQPIYSSSVARWKHYEKHIEPLLNELCRDKDIKRLIGVY